MITDAGKKLIEDAAREQGQEIEVFEIDPRLLAWDGSIDYGRSAQIVKPLTGLTAWVTGPKR